MSCFARIVKGRVSSFSVRNKEYDLPREWFSLVELHATVRIVLSGRFAPW